MEVGRGEKKVVGKKREEEQNAIAGVESVGWLSRNIREEDNIHITSQGSVGRSACFVWAEYVRISEKSQQVRRIMKQLTGYLGCTMHTHTHTHARNILGQ